MMIGADGDVRYHKSGIEAGPAIGLRMAMVVALLTLACGIAAAGPAELQLMQAAWRGETVKVRTLLDRGADAGAEDANGVSSLMMAAAKGNRTIANMLIHAGADPNRTGRRGCSAMTWAARNGWPEMIRFLAAQGARIDHQDGGGLTPLMRAAWNGKAAAVAALLALGADVTLRDRLGNTALGYALIQSEDEIAMQLRAAGAVEAPDAAAPEYRRPPLTQCAEPELSE